LFAENNLPSAHNDKRMIVEDLRIAAPEFSVANLSGM
jgi:hypothetical protein